MSDQAPAAAASPTPSETPAASPSDVPSSSGATTAPSGSAPDGREHTLIGEAAPAAPTETTETPEAEPKPSTPFDAAKLEFPAELGKPDEATLNKFTDVAKSLNLSQEGAQQLMNLHTDMLKAASETDRQSWVRTIDTWEKEIMNDPQIGGEKWPETQATIQKVLFTPTSPFYTPGLIEMLNVTGFGSCPAGVRSYAKLCEALSEGRAVSASPPGQSAPRSAAQALYPNLPSEAR
jgi:hypothetical protein